VAQADNPNVGGPQERARQDAHWVCVIQHERIGTHLLDEAAVVEHDRNGAKSAKDAADAEGIGNGLPETVFPGDFEIDDGRGLVSADLDSVDDVVRALESFCGVVRKKGRVGRICAEGLVDILHHDLGHMQPVRVDIDEGHLRVLETLLV